MLPKESVQIPVEARLHQNIAEKEQQRELAKRKELVGKLSAEIPFPKTVIIFGSTGRETIRPHSDLDVMVALEDLTKLSQVQSEFLPPLSTEVLRQLPSDITNISFNLKVADLPLHVEVYSAAWLRRLLSPYPAEQHRSAIFDPKSEHQKKPAGRWTTLRGKILLFERNLTRRGPFLIFDDIEPAVLESDLALRIEQAKLAFCQVIEDDLSLTQTIETNQRSIFLSAQHILGHSPTLDELTHAFTREEGGHVVPLAFSPGTRATAELIYQKGQRSKRQQSLNLTIPQVTDAEIATSREVLPKLPGSLRISVTDACNLKCVYCMGEGHLPMGAREATTMTPETFAEIANFWQQIGGKRIKYTGGEPFLNRHLSAFFAIAHELGFEQSITTNGYFLTQANLKLSKKFDISLVVSLDTLRKGEKSKMSPIGLPTEKIATKIVTAKNFGLEVAVNTVLTAYSRESVLHEMIPWALDNNIPLRILEEGTVLPGMTSGQILDLDTFAQEIAHLFNFDIQPRGEFHDLVALKDGTPIIYFLRSFCGRRDAESCAENSLRVNARGEAVPCMMRPERFSLHTKEDLLTAIGNQGFCPHQPEETKTPA